MQHLTLPHILPERATWDCSECQIQNLEWISIQVRYMVSTWNMELNPGPSSRVFSWSSLVVSWCRGMERPSSTHLSLSESEGAGRERWSEPSAESVLRSVPRVQEFRLLCQG
jgi:hypothetical protein